MANVFSVGRPARKPWAKVITGVRRVLGLHRAGKRRLQASREIIEVSLLFDSNWYLQKYPDVRRSGQDPLDHYLGLGWHEGRDPGPMFTTSAYLKANEDVARSGVNPLLHFVQFGMAEGREGFGSRQVPRSSSVTPTAVADPHPCLSFPRAIPPPVIWQRGFRLDRTNPYFVSIGATGAGYASGDFSREAVEAAVRRLRLLSGHATAGEDEPTLPSTTSERPADAWHVNRAQLRTRWNPAQLPLVVRAYQCSPNENGRERLIGEGVTSSGLDFIDVHPLSPYFPILFVLAEPDGAIRSAFVVGFPSLFRGAIHYPELIWASARARQSALNVAVIDQQLVEALLSLVGGRTKGAIEKITVDADKADGNGPLFQSDLRLWLDRVFQIAVVAGQGSVRDLRQANRNAKIDREGGAVLVLPGDSAPTIAALLAQAGPLGGQDAPKPVPLLVSHLDPSEPALLIDIPASVGPVLAKMPNDFPWVNPAAGHSVPADFPASAIRTSSGYDLNDARLLIPIAGPIISSDERRAAISWLIEVEAWSEVHLAQALHTLSVQRFAEGDVIALIGLSTAAAATLARTRFPGGVKRFETRADAIARLNTPLAGCIGPGVMLHDARTADCFSTILANDAVATASCVIVSVEKRSGVVQTAVVDGGAVVSNDRKKPKPAESAAIAVELWGATYPVAKPSAYLWATRSARLQSSSQASAQAARALHLCSSIVTASCLKPSAAIRQPPEFPEGVGIATTVERLVG